MSLIATEQKLEKKVVGISDMQVSSDPSDLLVTYSLGSCLGVVLYDYMNQVGGLSHIMLPESGLEKLSDDSIAFNPLKYVDSAMPVFLNDYYDAGGRKKSTVVSVFGGAKLFKQKDMFNIGKRNFAEFRKYLWKAGLLIKHKHVGGTAHRTVKLFMDTGIIKVEVNKEDNITYKCGR